MGGGGNICQEVDNPNEWMSLFQYFLEVQQQELEKYNSTSYACFAYSQPRFSLLYSMCPLKTTRRTEPWELLHVTLLPQIILRNKKEKNSKPDVSKGEILHFFQNLKKCHVKNISQIKHKYSTNLFIYGS